MLFDLFSECFHLLLEIRARTESLFDILCERFHLLLEVRPSAELVFDHLGTGFDIGLVILDYLELAFPGFRLRGGRGLLVVLFDFLEDVFVFVFFVVIISGAKIGRGAWRYGDRCR